MKGDIEVAPDGDNWVVQRQGDPVVLARLKDKVDAVEYGRNVARSAGVEFFIKKADGTIADKDSHGNDPSEIEG